jgi:hypothetical protein
MRDGGWLLGGSQGVLLVVALLSTNQFVRHSFPSPLHGSDASGNRRGRQSLQACTLARLHGAEGVQQCVETQLGRAKAVIDVLRVWCGAAAHHTCL